MGTSGYSIISSICSSESYLVITDSTLNTSNGYLRSIPLIAALTSGNKLSIKSQVAGKNCKCPVNILDSFVSYGEVTESLDPDAVSIIAINKELDAEKHYVSRYIEGIASPRIFLSPEKEYVPSGWPTGDRTIDDETVSMTKKYDYYYSQFLKTSPLSEFELRETKNIAFMELAYRTYQITGKKIHTLHNLFDYQNPDFSLSPIWDICYNIIKMREMNIVADWPIYIFNSIRPWLETYSDVDKLKDILYEKIQEAKFNVEKLSEQRQELYLECDVPRESFVEPLYEHFIHSNPELLNL